MPESLGQSEIDALLDAIGTGSLPTGPASAVRSEEKRYELHDFRLAAETYATRSLEAIHESLARNLAESLSSYLRTGVDIRLIALEQRTWRAFISSVPTPTSLSLISAAPLNGELALEINPSVIFPFIDRLLGGGVRESEPPNRPLTEIEQGLAATIVTRIAEQSREAWKGIGDIDFKVVSTHSDPRLIPAIAADEPAIIARFAVTLEKMMGNINICIPRRALEPVAADLAARLWLERPSRDEKDDARIVALNIAMAAVECSCRLAGSAITLNDLLDLRVGDIIQTEDPAGGDAALCVEGTPIFLGEPGLSRGKKALLIKSPAAPHKSAGRPPE